MCSEGLTSRTKLKGKAKCHQAKGCCSQSGLNKSLGGTGELGCMGGIWAHVYYEPAYLHNKGAEDHFHWEPFALCWLKQQIPPIVTTHADIRERFEICPDIFPVGDKASGSLSYFKNIKLCIAAVVLCHWDNIVEACLGKWMTFRASIFF